MSRINRETRIRFYGVDTTIGGLVDELNNTPGHSATLWIPMGGDYARIHVERVNDDGSRTYGGYVGVSRPNSAREHNAEWKIHVKSSRTGLTHEAGSDRSEE